MSRVLTTNENLSCSYSQWSGSNTPSTLNYNGVSTVDSWTRSDVTSSPPDATGWRQPTAYTSSRITRVEWIGDIYYLKRAKLNSSTWVSNGRRATGCLSLLPSSNNMSVPALVAPSPSFPSQVTARAINNALSNLKDQKVQYATFLAESGSAAKMIGANAYSIYDAYRKIRAGDMRGAAQSLRVTPKRIRGLLIRKRTRNEKEVASRWLELQYGWLPLLSDTYGIYEDIRNGFFRTARIATVGRGQDERSQTYYGAGNSFVTVGGTLKQSFGSYVRYDYTVDSERLAFLAQKGLTNPLEVAWELIPFSFVVDWFASIGDFLSTLDADLALTFKKGSISERILTECNAVLYALPYKGDENTTYTVNASGTSSYRKVTMTRRVISVPPSGQWYLKGSINATRALNAIALLRQLRL